MLCAVLFWLPSGALIEGWSATSPQMEVLELGSEVLPMSNEIIWRYKIEKQKIYRRLYNTANGKWLGEWEYVRDL